MRLFHIAALAAAGLALAAPAYASSIPMDTPTMIDGVDTVCTGIGDEAQHDPRWSAYSTRIEFSNGGAQYLSGAHVTLSEGAKTLAAVDCSGPWVLFKLAPGSYKATATITDQPGAGTKSAAFSAPAHGQKRVVIQFPTAANQ